VSTSGSAAVLVSVISGLLIGLSVWLAARPKPGVAQRVKSYVHHEVSHREQVRSLIERALGDKQARQITRSPFMTRMRVELEVSAIKLKPEQLLLLVAVGTVVCGWLLGTTMDSPLAAALALFIPAVAYFSVSTLAGRQRRAFSEQLPDNLQVIASSMRAGQTFVGALRGVVNDAPEPSKREFNRVVTDEALGIPLPDSLNQVTERMRSDDFRHVAIVAALQRETGGNTAEVVDLVAETVRERIEIRRMVRGLTAQGRLSGGVLSMLPVGLLVMMSLMNPTYVYPEFHTTAGMIALGVALGLVIIGALLIRKLVDIKV
jgi:tight adherence protein B